MNIDVSHRSKLYLHKKKDYYHYAEECIDKLSSLKNISSIILCGSLAKNDVVPGWSDIDLIVFLKDNVNGIRDIQLIKESLNTVAPKYEIGIGLDIVYEKEFELTKKICGRPYAMTFEVAQYGITKLGKNYLEDIVYTRSDEELVGFERKLLIASEIHSWRRRFVLADADPGSIDHLFNVSKSLLRILQIEAGPYLKKPISCLALLDRYKDLRGENDLTKAISLAVSVREKWHSYITADREEITNITLSLSDYINSYNLQYMNQCEH